MPVQCTCTVCGAVFYRKPSAVGPVCSQACYGLKLLKPVVVSCAACGRKLTRKPSDANQRRSFCSTRCLATPVPLIPSDDALTFRVPLHRRDGAVAAHATIDASDAAFVAQWRWSLLSGYARRVQWEGDRSLTIWLHRELLGLPRVTDGRIGDHIDRDRLNDRRSNLRIIHKGANAQNQTSYVGSSSQFRGVSWTKANQKWSAGVTYRGKRHHLGYFSSELDAAEAARAGRIRILPHAVD